MPAYSPVLSVCTALFEIAVAARAFTAAGRRPVLRPAGTILLLLAGYQLLEVFVCGHPDQNLAARIAFSDIVWLPPAGCWLILELGAPDVRRARHLVRGLFSVAAFLTAWVMLDPGFVHLTVCQAVIATYNSPSPLYTFYGGFYQLGLFSMMFGAAFALVRTDDRTLRQHLADVQIGTIGFVVPSLLTEVVRPELLGSMPSVMCHYALVLAIFLSRLVAREHRMTAPVVAPGRLSTVG